MILKIYYWNTPYKLILTTSIDEVQKAKISTLYINTSNKNIWAIADLALQFLHSIIRRIQWVGGGVRLGDGVLGLGWGVGSKAATKKTIYKNKSL